MGIRVAADFVRFCYREPDPERLGKLFSKDVRVNDTMSSDKEDLSLEINNPFSYGGNKIFPRRIGSVSYQPDKQNRSVKV
jgi:cytochrome c biogenesis protein ResB